MLPVEDAGPPEPLLGPSERLALAQAVAQFNHGHYFECHETLEDLWRGLEGPSRDFFQALIQVSVGFHHLERGNRAGAIKTFEKAHRRFERFPDHYLGFDVAGQRTRLQGPPEGRPTWRFEGVVEDASKTP